MKTPINHRVYDLILGEFTFHYRGKKYVIKNPSLRITSEAEKVYQDVFHRNKYSGFMSEADCLRLLVNSGIVSPDVDKNIPILQKQIEKFQINLFEAIVSSRKDLEQKSRKMILQLKEKLSSTTSKRHSLDYLTVSGFAEMHKRQFIITKTLHNEQGELEWPSLEKVDSDLMNFTISKINENQLTQEELREIARNDPWKSYWSIGKPNPFEISAYELSSEQRILVMFSKMYDSASEHPDCPSDKIIEDDDAFDGWMASERNKREKEDSEKTINKKVGQRHQNASEVFIPASSAEEAKKIDRFNSVEAKMIKKQREKVIQSQGEVKESQLPDQRVKIRMQALEQSKKLMKGK